MRRLSILAAILVLAAIVAGLALDGRDRPVIAHPPRMHRSAPLPEGFDAPMQDVLPMHRAVRLARGRFDGRVLDIGLYPASDAEAQSGVQLIYRLRMVTPARDVLDIRMDALTGRFVEISGADLGAARKTRSTKHEDD